MKTKVTQKFVKATHRAVLSVGYCGLQNLLAYESPWAYTAGVYGWKADIYSFGNVAISTGYSPFGREVPYDVYHKYDVAAEEVRKESRWDYEKAKPKLDELILKFIEEVARL